MDDQKFKWQNQQRVHRNNESNFRIITDHIIPVNNFYFKEDWLFPYKLTTVVEELTGAAAKGVVKDVWKKNQKTI